jgi:SpoVK/Ycf46/Vps4 family AAA+-type ATPase
MNPTVKKATFLGKVNFNELEPGQEITLFDDSSDVMTNDIANNGIVYTYGAEITDRPNLEPGFYEVSYNRYGEPKLVKSEIKTVKFFGDNPVQQELISRCFKFFEKASIFEQFEETARMGFLVAGEAGTGKTATLNYICSELLVSNDTCIIKFDTRNNINNLSSLMRGKIPTEAIKKVVVVLEDLGGGEGDPKSTAKFSDGALLSFLDGNSYPYDIPIVIFATTNYPENMLANLVDRPGRFDDVVFINAPSITTKAQYMESLLKRPITVQEKKYIEKNHSMAHIKKAVVNLLVHGTPIDEMLIAMTKHSEKVKRDELNEREDERVGI